MRKFEILLEEEKIDHYHEGMVDKPNFNPDSVKPPVNSPASAKPPANFDHKEAGGWNPKPLHWMGMNFDSKQTKMLWNIISQNIGNQIKKEQDRAVKAIRKLNPDNNEDS